MLKNKKAQKPIIVSLIVLFVLGIFITSYFVLANGEGPKETIKDGRKYADNGGIILSTQTQEWCEWKPDGKNDGYKICNSVIEVNNTKEDIKLKNLRKKFDFDISNKEDVKDLTYTFYWSNTSESYNETILDYECLDQDSSVSNCSDQVERRNWTSWIEITKKDKTRIKGGEIVAFKIKYEIPQYQNASYNFAILEDGNERYSIDPDISACGTLSTGGATYTLTSDINNVIGSCFTIGNNSITLDMQGHTISGHAVQASPYGVYQTSYSSTTIKNGTIDNFEFGIYLEASQFNDVKNMVITNSEHTGIVIFSTSDGNNVTNCTCNGATYNGILLETNCDNNILINNTANENAGGDGVYLLSGSDSNIIQDSTFLNNGKRGIYILGSTTINNNLTNNLIRNSSEEGIRIQESSGNILKNNIVNNHTLHGILLYDSASGNSLINNTANYNLQTGVVMHTTCSNNNLTNNTINNNGQNGIYVYSSSNNNIFTNNTANSNTQYGLYLNSNSVNNSLVGNTLSNDEIGLAIALGSDSNNATNNIINSNEYGIYITNNCDDNIFTNNTINLNLYAGINMAANSNSNLFQGINLINNTDDAITVINSNNTQFINVTLDTCYDTSSDGVIWITNASHSIFQNANLTTNHTTLITFAENSENNTFLNCSYDKAESIGSNSELIRKWYFDAQVNYTHNSSAVNEANVSAYNTTSDFQFSVLSGSSGSITQQSLIEYTNDGTVVYHNNHTINATKSGWGTSSHAVNMTTNILQQFDLSDINDPSVVIVSPLNKTYNTNSIDFNLTATDDGIIDSCWYTIDSGVKNTTMSNDTVSNFYNTNSSMTQGSHTVDFYCNDTGGNINNTESEIFFIDSIYPQIDYDTETPTDYANLSQSFIYINVTWTEINLANITFSLFNDSVEVNSTTFTTATYDINWTGLVESNNYTYQINITDIGNNKNYTTLGYITLDVSNPDTNLTFPTNTTSNSTTSQNFTADLSDNLGIKNATLYIYNSTDLVNETTTSFSQDVLTYSLGIVVTLVEEVYDWFYKIFDWSGNSAESGNYTLTIDTTNPQISLVYPTNITYTSVQTELNFSYSDTNKDACWYSTDGGSTNTTHVSCANLTGLNSGQGSKIWLIGINDSAGNENYSIIQFFVDDISPQIDYDTETPADYANLSQSNIYVNVTWTETYLANITFSLYNDSVEVNSTTFTTATYDINWTGLVDSNNYTYQVNITDLANSKNYTSIRHITLDVSNPDTNLTTPSNNTNTSTTSQNFTTNLSDNLGIKNATLYIYNSSNDLVNETTTSFTADVLTYTLGIVVDLVDEVYQWFYKIFDWAGNSAESGNYTITIDTTKPYITIDHPKSQSYSYNESLSLNYTITDSGVGIDSCWFKVVNSSSDVVISNTIIASCLNTTFNVSRSDSYTLTLYSNDTLNHLNSSSVSFSVSLVAPSIVLDYPPNRTYLSNGTNVNINFTATDTDGLDTCSLWHNNTGTWHKNYTWIGPTSGVQNNTTLNFLENTFKWNVWCNDTFDNMDWALYNLTLTIDETNPQVSLVYPTNTSYSSVQTELNFSYYDLYVDSCWYSTNGGATNTTHTSCANLTGLVSGQGSKIWLIGINDSAGNENYSIIQFLVDSIYPQIDYDTETEVDYVNKSQSNIYVNVTWTEANLANITFSLYNATATVNSTTFTIATYDINWTGLNDDSNYTYEVNITDTLNQKNYTSIRHITLDTIKPNVTITTPNNTQVTGLSRTLDYNISDIHLEKCYFTLWTTGGLPHNYPENSSLNCSANSTSVSSLNYGTFIIQIWGEDYAGNLNESQVTFTTRASIPSAGGGGGAVVIVVEEEIVEKTFCGDAICQPEGNDYGIKEDWYNCPQDCKGFDLDALLFSFTKYCFDDDPSTVCFFTQLFVAVPMGENATIVICGDGVCDMTENVWSCPEDCGEKFSMKLLYTNCIDDDPTTPCFFDQNISYLILFSFGGIILGTSFIKVRIPGKKRKISPYGYVKLKMKRKKWRR